MTVKELIKTLQNLDNKDMEVIAVEKLPKGCEEITGFEINKTAVLDINNKLFLALGDI